MNEKERANCPICGEVMMDTDFGPMCWRALKSWKRVGDQWKRSFAGHPESNAAERQYLEAHGLPESPG